MVVTDFIVSWIQACWAILAEAGVWLLLGFVMGGLIASFVPGKFLVRHLGGHGIFSVLKASLIGAPLPLCSCSVIPTVAGLRRAGAGKGGAAAFAIATPEVDAPSVSITWAMVNWQMALLRPVAAVLSALVVGIFIDKTDNENAETESAPVPVPDAEFNKTSCGCSSGGCCSGELTSPAESASAPSFLSKLYSAGKHAFVELPRDLGAWMLVGITLSGLLIALIPDGWIEAHVEGGKLGTAGSMLLMLVIGIPWYICATSSTPLAAALMAKGLSPGAGLVFLLAGPATNPATMGWVWRDLGKKALVIYIAGISVVALLVGMLANLFLPRTINLSSEALQGETTGILPSVAAGVVLFLLIWGVSKPLISAVRVKLFVAKPVTVAEVTDPDQ